MRIILALCAALALAGCETDGVKPETLQPICEALIGPIHYSTHPQTEAARRRYAGPDLAPELKKRNDVGVNLRCPAYR